MMSYDYYYDNARSRYYDACSEVNSYENRANELRNERQRKVNQINEINADINRYQTAIQQIDDMLKKENGMLDQCSAITTSVSEAAENFMAMAQSSDICAKNLSDVYGTESNTRITEVFNEISQKKNTLSGQLETLQTNKKNAETELDQIDYSNNDISYWGSQKRSASMDMDYYKSKMDQEN
jgi:chromosome segregation ATPase